MKRSKHEETPVEEELCEDVIHEILLRLPLKSLGKCKLVSKLWNSIISNPEFAKAHLQFPNLIIGNSPSFLALQKDNTISSLKFDQMVAKGKMVAKGACTSCLTPLGKYFEPHKYGGDSLLVGSCDGLVCIYSKKEGKRQDRQLYLWNPTINKHKQIPLPAEKRPTYLHFSACWFGFVSSLNTYKVFLVYNAYRPRRSGFVERKCIFSFRDQKWREIRQTIEMGGKESAPRLAGSDVTVMNEALHYLATDHKFIHKFDLVSESYERIPLLIKPKLLDRASQGLLGVVGEDRCMCAMLVHFSEELIFDLWMLQEYNKWDSWKRLYKLDMHPDIANDCSTRLYGFTQSGYLCIEGGKELMLIDPSHNPPLYFYLKKCSVPVYWVIDHVDSLVSPLSLFLS